MKKFILLFVFFLLLLPVTTCMATTSMSARDVMERVDGRDDGDRSRSDMRMILIDRRDNISERILRSYAMDKGEDRYSLLYFMAPADVKNSGFLTYDYENVNRDDDQWLYLPALKKTKRIAANDKSGSFMGSDFSYADLTKRRLDDYTYTFHATKEMEVYDYPVWVIDAIPRTEAVIKETGYNRSILFVRKDNFVVVRAIHFLENKGELKYYDVKEMAKVDTIWTERIIHMTRKKGGKTIHRTILSLENIHYNQEDVNENLFTVRTLENGL